jgi:hypothetical protein
MSLLGNHKLDTSIYMLATPVLLRCMEQTVGGQCFHWAGGVLYKEGNRQVSQFQKDIRAVQFCQRVARVQFSARSEL